MEEEAHGEIDFSDLKLREELGRGSFGVVSISMLINLIIKVFRGKYSGRDVASKLLILLTTLVKQLLANKWSESDFKGFLREINLLR